MNKQLSVTASIGGVPRSDWSLTANERASLWIRLKNISGLAADWRERWWYRRELRRLASDGSHLIDDVGLTLREAQVEMAKPFWHA